MIETDPKNGTVRKERGRPARNRIHPDDLAERLDALETMDHATLKAEWTDAYDTTPLKGLSRRLMVHALAYELQVQHMGQLKQSIRQDLHKFAAPETSQSPVTAPTKLTPGTRLMREWRGTVHVVDVTEGGLVWNGRTFTSLSAIARTITGTRWSGQRFFGLRKRSDAVNKSQTGRAEVSAQNSPLAAHPQPNEGRCSDELSSSLRPTGTGTKCDHSRHPDNVNAERAASMADNSKPMLA